MINILDWTFAILLSFPPDIAVFKINVYDIVEVGSRREKEVTNISRVVLLLVENSNKQKIWIQ